ncbi:MAG: penicillin-binding protein 1C [Pseudomonadota bacterium]|nr:penicillin-binding protein 1C [Pseudomonadota bacterium]
MAACLIASGSSQAGAVPSFAQIKREHRPSETLLLDRHGQPIHRLRSDARVRRGPWVPLADISPALRQALVLSEDKRFYEHSGVDWRAVSAAAWGNLWHSKTRGASTLTMQLAGLIDEDLALGTGGRSLRQKIGQALMARQLESGWRKDEILEAYLNLVPLRGELVGVDALARTLFAKAPHGLQDTEAAITAALVRAPNARPAAVAQRACGVLRAMRQGSGQPADCVALDMQTEAVLTRRAWAPSEGLAPHLARRLLAEQRRLAASGSAPAEPGQIDAPVLHSTLDARVQRLAVQLLQQHLQELRGRHVHDGAVIVLDNASGEVLAWVGSSGPVSQAAEVDGVLAARQPGSTLKPFLYAQALAEKRLTAASLLHDSPAHLQTASGLYIPQNYDRRFKGWVSVRTALASSLNVPAVRTLVMVSPEAFARQLDALGMALREGGGYYGYSLALGSAEVSLLHLANAYRALALGGRVCPVHTQPPATDARRAPCTQALDAGAAFITADMLADNNARAPTFGTDSVLATRFWSAVKTGTSKDMRDNWALGFSQHYTVGVWVGNASGAAMWDVSGTSGAAPVWAALMQHLHSGSAARSSRAPQPPAHLLRQRVRFGYGASAAVEAAREEWFLLGTAQAVFALDAAPDARAAQAARVAPRITGLQNGTILALDPDIPPARQRLHLAADPGGTPAAALRWYIGTRAIGQGATAQWLPWPGRHVVQLRDAHGAVHDERRIEVRGAVPRKP